MKRTIKKHILGLEKRGCSKPQTPYEGERRNFLRTEVGKMATAANETDSTAMQTHTALYVHPHVRLL